MDKSDSGQQTAEFHFERDVILLFFCRFGLPVFINAAVVYKNVLSDLR